MARSSTRSLARLSEQNKPVGRINIKVRIIRLNPRERATIYFFSQYFPWWGNCHFRFVDHSGVLYIHSTDVTKRQQILQELQSIRANELGISQIVFSQPNCPDILISMGQAGRRVANIAVNVSEH